MDVTPPDTAHALNVGRAARDLIATEAYETVMMELQEYHVQAMAAAPEGPTGAEALAHHHRMLKALRELHEEFSARAAGVGALEAKLGADALIQTIEDTDIHDDEL